MSADNYYLVKAHPQGGFTAVMGFASDDHPAREGRSSDPSFPTALAAYGWAEEQEAEYGPYFDKDIKRA